MTRHEFRLVEVGIMLLNGVIGHMGVLYAFDGSSTPQERSHDHVVPPQAAIAFDDLGVKEREEKYSSKNADTATRSEDHRSLPPTGFLQETKAR